MTDYLPAVEIEPATPANASVIWLHGLGADGHDFEPVAKAMHFPPPLAIRWILPHAPELPVTVNGGYVMPAWYDILRFGEERSLNREQLQASADKVHALIDREIARGIPSHRIILAGFSQGGAVIYHAGLSYPKRLGGLLGLSTYFPTSDTLAPHMAQVGIPVMICHGTEDTVVVMNMGRSARRALENFGLAPQFRSYVMAHAVCQQEVVDIAGFYQKCLSSQQS
ncbi:MAG TPA: hypothetical protein VMH83_06935 [Candidatus Acidoferrum sp.]|nr:hypothetical protein [Candidatus Acidoferrum sp.]